MTTPPTEDHARALLAQAAATVEVDESAPMSLTGLPEPRSRRWPVLAAVAAVLVAVGGGWLVAQQLGDNGGQPQPVVTPTPRPTEASDRNTMPGLIGLTRQEAVRLLQQQGLSVRVRRQQDGCNEPGIVTGSTPVVGSTLEPGQLVTVDVVVPQVVVDCVGEPSWRTIWALLRSARGLEADVRLLDGVRIPADVRDALADALSAPWAGPGAPTVGVLWTYDDPVCTPDHVPGDDKLRIWVGAPIEGRDSCPVTSVLLSFDDRGRLAQVELDDGPGLSTDELASSMERLSSAQKFVSWARGTGPAPAFADRVRVMYRGGGAFGSTGWVDHPEYRGGYLGCSGVGFPACGLDPVAILFRYQGHVVATRGRSVCADGGEVPKRFAEAPEDVVRLEEPEPASCAHTWAVELWIDADGVVYGVNQAGG